MSRWEECKQLLLTPNFFESLKFFDRDGVPRSKLRQLRTTLRSPLWRVDTLQHASRYILIYCKKQRERWFVCVSAPELYRLWLCGWLLYWTIIMPGTLSNHSKTSSTRQRKSSLRYTWIIGFFWAHHEYNIMHTYTGPPSIVLWMLFIVQAEITLVAKQKDMLETKEEFRRAQKQRNNIRREKTVIETKITVSLSVPCICIYTQIAHGHG